MLSTRYFFKLSTHIYWLVKPILKSSIFELKPPFYALRAQYPWCHCLFCLSVAIEISLSGGYCYTPVAQPTLRQEQVYNFLLNLHKQVVAISLLQICCRFVTDLLIVIIYLFCPSLRDNIPISPKKSPEPSSFKTFPVSLKHDN